MFGRKARLIRELKAANETNKITIRMQDETIKKYMDLAEARGNEAVSAQAKVATLTASLAAEKDQSLNLLSQLNQLRESAGKLQSEREIEFDSLRKELEKCREELLKALEKVQSLEEELRLARNEASEAARRNSFGGLDEVNSFPGEHPSEKKAESLAEFRESLNEPFVPLHLRD